MTVMQRRVLIAGVILIAGGGIAWAVFSSRGDARGEQAPGGAASGGMAGMDMSGGGNGSVTLSGDQMRTFSVALGIVERRMLEDAVRTVGSVTIDETRVAQVATRVGGFIERLYVDFTGQPVRRGQPLLDIYSPELLAAQQELLLAAQLEANIGHSPVPGVPVNATNLVAAAKRRFALWDVSDAQVNEVLRTGRTRRTMTLFAPSSGIVTEKKVVRGQSVVPGEHMYTIVDLSRVWVEAEIREADIARVRVGSGADVEVTGIPGRTFKGRVEYVAPMVQGDSRTVRARVAVANTAGLLKPGMYATVRLLTPTRMALTVPSSAILHTGERALVFVDMGGGKLMPHEIESGRVAGDYTEVLSGVDAGQRVVTSAQFLLDSESNLAEIMKGMLGMGSGRGGKPASDAAGMSDKGADMKGMPGMAPSASSPKPR